MVKECQIQKDHVGNLAIITGYTPFEIARLKELPKEEAERKVFADIGDMANVIYCGYGYHGQMTFGHNCVYLKIGDTND
jgi:hypothetical protein